MYLRSFPSSLPAWNRSETAKYTSQYTPTFFVIIIKPAKRAALDSVNKPKKCGPPIE